jgi:hypothetical protein
VQEQFPQGGADTVFVAIDRSAIQMAIANRNSAFYGVGNLVSGQMV